MIIRVERRHVVYVVSVCGILNEGGKKNSCYTFRKLQNIQLHPSSPSPPPSPPGTHTIDSITLQIRAKAFSLQSCSSLRTPSLFIRKSSSLSLRDAGPNPAPSLTYLSPGRLFRVPKPLAFGHKVETVVHPYFESHAPGVDCFYDNQTASSHSVSSLRP